MSYITINKADFFHNLDYLCKKLGSKEKLAVVLKDNAYGHGLTLIAKLSYEFGITKAVVKTEDEAKEIKEFFKDIIVLNPDFSDKSFSLVINSLEQLKSSPKSFKIHLKIDTGMHRNGIMTDEIEEAFKIILEKEHNLEGVLTHFRSADELSSELFWQQKQWKEAKEKTKSLCKKYDLKTPLFHSANSAATLRLSSYEDDFARCGIALYGYHEMEKSFGDFPLKPVLKLYAQKISSRELKKGARVGYGGVGKLQNKSIVSTYDIGYGDGFFRNIYPDILGRVSMDSFSMISDKDEVCIIKDAKEIAKQNNTISYDVLVKLNSKIKRVIV